MPIYISRTPQWKPLPNSKRVSKQCPRCRNITDFELVYDVEGLGIENTIFFLKTKTFYAIHCPICVYYQDVSKSTAMELGA
jgi:predicted nucleic-acid-binding Zn-ribbon protein